MALRTPQVWHEALARRRALHATLTEAGLPSRETRPVDQPVTWLDDLRAQVAVVVESVVGDPDPATGDPVDVRDALLDLLAAAWAWVDALDGKTETPT